MTINSGKNPTVITVLAIGVTVAGCYPKAGPPPGALTPDRIAEASKRWPGVTEASLAEGQQLFLANCSKCHDYPDLAAIPEDEWPDIVERMAGKADLEAKQGDAILHWILASRPQSPSGS